MELYQLIFQWVGDHCPSRHLFEIGCHVLLNLEIQTPCLICLCCRLLGPYEYVHNYLDKLD